MQGVRQRQQLPNLKEVSRTVFHFAVVQIGLNKENADQMFANNMLESEDYIIKKL